MLSGKSVLITGGTGSFGREFVRTVLQNYPDVRRLIVFSRDELKQYEMEQEFPLAKHTALRFFLGDVRDLERLTLAFQDVDYVIHAAALKQVPAAEYNPMECIKTNILGSDNVIKAALKNTVKRVIALSTDKAAAPANLYGATKLCSDKLFVAANNLVGSKDLRFSVVRYGNVLGSRGSVVPFFLEKKKTGRLPITHPEMTRFNITLDQGVATVLRAIKISRGGEIFIPKIPSYRILDVANAVSSDCEIEFVGLRPGEKLHEEMITSSDSFNALEFNDYYVICPSSEILDRDKLARDFGGRPVSPGFCYSSDNNAHWMSVHDLQLQIKNFVSSDRSFQQEH